MMDFGNVKEITIPEGVVLKIMSGSKLIWEKIVQTYTNLVPTATDNSGNILDGKGYSTGAYWMSNATMEANSACTAIGFIPINGSVQHEIYLYGINLTGTNKNNLLLCNSAYRTLSGSLNIKEGKPGNALANIEKLGDYYYKLTTNTYSANVAYFCISGVSVSGLVPIVTMDEPIM